MSGLMLHYAGGGWELRVANTKAVIGLKLGEQGVSENVAVKRLAQAMQGGADQVVSDAKYIFENESQIDAEFIKNLFGAARQLLMESRVIFEATSDLFAEMASAGRALAALL